MNPTFKKMKDAQCDAICFLPDSESAENIVMQGLTYKEKGDTIGSSVMGDSYDIITFRGYNGEYFNKDHFDAILVCPYTYGDKLVNEGYYGVIAKRTTTSSDMVNLILQRIDDLIASSNGVNNAKV